MMVISNKNPFKLLPVLRRPTSAVRVSIFHIHLTFSILYFHFPNSISYPLRKGLAGLTCMSQQLGNEVERQGKANKSTTG